MLYKEYKEKWNNYKYIKLISPLKKSDEFSWLKEVNSQSLQQAIIDLDKGFKNFFQKRAKYPQFKSKHKSKKAFRVPQFVKVNFDAKRVFIPKFKEGIKCKLHRMFFGTIKNATVSMTKSGKYFISIIVDDEITVPALKREPVKHNSLGIDLGIKDFAILSDGTKISNPEIKQYNKKIERLHRKLSKKQKGSKNRQKAKIALACLYEKVNNIKSDFLHKLSRKIINENQIDHIFIEDLNVNGMIKNHKLARSIQAASWYKFYTLLAYKAEEAGKHLNKIGRFFPSSKMCSVCGYKNDALTLKDREWICPDCGTSHDRDLNAAINIRNFGINTVGTTGIKACGENVIPAHSEVVLCEARSSHFKN
jgi:putative transposase